MHNPAPSPAPLKNLYKIINKINSSLPPSSHIHSRGDQVLALRSLFANAVSKCSHSTGTNVSLVKVAHCFVWFPKKLTWRQDSNVRKVFVGESQKMLTNTKMKEGSDKNQ